MMPLIPIPDAIPTAWGYFQFFLMLTFPLHLLVMNALLGASGVALVLHLRGDEPSRRLAFELAKAIPLLVALTVNFGVAPLLFLQVLYGHLMYTSSVLMGMFWILIIPMLLTAYAATYWYDFRFAQLGRAGLAVLGGALLLFLLIGFLLSNNMTLMLQPERWGAYLENSAGTLLNTGDPALWPRYLHVMVGGSAVGGLFVALYGRVLARRDALLGDRATALGLKLFALLTLVQVAVGVWFLLALPRELMLLFMGGHPLATASFVVGLLLTAAALLAAFRRRLRLASVLGVALVGFMTVMRDVLRGGYLADVFSAATLPIVPEYSPLLLFLATLAVGLVLIAWMVRAALTRCTP